MRKVHFPLLLLVISLIACKKADNNSNNRPDYHWSETTCTINGKLWGDCSPSSTLPGVRSAKTSAQSLGDGFLISATNICGIRPNDVVNVYIRSLFALEEGSFVLNDFHQGGIQLTALALNSRDTIETDMTHTGELIIDRFEGKRISGRFHFQAYHKQRDSVYTVANGQFEDVFVYNL